MGALLGYGSVRFRVKYKTEPIFYAEITYEQITKMSVNQAGYFVKTSMRMREAQEHGDRNIVAYYEGKLDAYRFILTNDMLDTKK